MTSTAARDQAKAICSVPAISVGNSAVSAKPSDLLEDKARTVPDLIALANVLDTLVQIANAFTSTTRMEERRGVLNDAGTELDDLTDVLVDRHLNVMDRLRDARPVTKREAEDRACALLRWDLECNQDVTDVALAAVRKEMPERF